MNDERTLWRSLENREKASGMSACPDPNIFSAYAENRASDEEVAEVEAHLNHCDACLETLMVLRSPAPDLSMDVPARMRERAMNLVARGRVVALARPRFRSVRRTAAATALAASLLLTCIGGFQLGEEWISDVVLFNAESSRLFGNPFGRDLTVIP